MVETLTLVVLGGALYLALVTALQRADVVPSSVRFSGPLTTIHTVRGKALLDWLARPRRWWRAWGNLGVGMALVVMAGSFLLVAVAGYTAFSRPADQPIQDPRNFLVFPGVNDFLPLSAAPEILFGLLVALVVHEGGHGLLCRVEDIEIESMGLALFTVLPVGAFVQPDEDSRAAADRGGQTRMFAAGVTNNVAITVVAALLLFGPVAGSITTVAGVHVGGALPGSSADGAGIGKGDVITGVDGTSVENRTELERALAATDASTVTVQTRDGPVTVERRVQILQIAPGVARSSSLSTDRPPTVVAVNGTNVSTPQGFERTLADHHVARVETTNGSVVVPVGAAVVPTTNGSFVGAGAPASQRAMVVTAFDGRRTANGSALSAAIDAHEPGDTVTVEAVADGQNRSYEVTLGADENGSAHLGASIYPGTSGLVVGGHGVREYPADRYLTLIGGGDGLLGGLDPGTAFRNFSFLLFAPLLSLVGLAPFNFAGFTGGVENFYVARGPLAALGGWLLLVANLAFWTAWINVQVALFNCIPSYPLDGGHILRTTTEAVVARLPIAGKQRVTTIVTVGTTVAMLAALALMAFAPMLLA